MTSVARVQFRELRGIRVAALLLQALAVLGLAASTLGYSALDSRVRTAELDPLLFFSVGAILFFLFSLALAVRFPLDLLLRVPALGIAAACLWRSVSLVFAFPKLFSVPAPLHLILSYLALPTAFTAATIILGADLIADARRRAAGRSHAA